MCAIFGTSDRQQFITLYELNKDRGGYASTFCGIKDGKLHVFKNKLFDWYMVIPSYYNVFNSLGTMTINEHSDSLKKLSEGDKSSLSKSGIRVGTKFFFMPHLLKKSPMELNALLWKVYYESQEKKLYPLPNDGRVSFLCNFTMPESYWFSIGYLNLSGFLIRADVFERIFFIARQKVKYGPFLESSELMNPVGCNSDQLKKILNYLLYLQ